MDALFTYQMTCTVKMPCHLTNARERSFQDLLVDHTRQEQPHFTFTLGSWICCTNALRGLTRIIHHGGLTSLARALSGAECGLRQGPAVRGTAFFDLVLDVAVFGLAGRFAAERSADLQRRGDPDVPDDEGAFRHGTAPDHGLRRKPAATG